MQSIGLELHKLFNNQKRYSFPFSKYRKEIPSNGIYIIFEHGERFRDFDRVVRIGTHTGHNQLYSRLKEHFIKKNKNRSIFRKNIGRCFLNKEQNPYLRMWNLDTTTSNEKKAYSSWVDVEFEKQMEERISNYIQENLSFCVFNVDTKEERLFWESKIASTLAQENDIVPSREWLGNYSPKEKIRESGLWQVNGLEGEVISEKELLELKALLEENSYK